MRKYITPISIILLSLSIIIHLKFGKHQKEIPPPPNQVIIANDKDGIITYDTIISIHIKQ